jgi:hypothetical protein
VRVEIPPAPSRSSALRELYLVSAVGWPGSRRRLSPCRVKALVRGYGELARVVLWLELLGYACRVRRVR